MAAQARGCASATVGESSSTRPMDGFDAQAAAAGSPKPKIIGARVGEMELMTINNNNINYTQPETGRLTGLTLKEGPTP